MQRRWHPLNTVFLTGTLVLALVLVPLKLALQGLRWSEVLVGAAMVFAIGTAIVCGASFVYGSIVVGPQAAAEMMYLGLLGVAILAIVFVRQLRAL